MSKKFYITTAIDYTNSSPHLGHLYEKICADCIARWHRLLGEDVFFLTGTDEHGQKVENAALKLGKKTKQFVDSIVEEFKKLCKVYNISNDYFIRTTDPQHEEFCKEIFKKVYDKGEIYKGEYSGYYCTGCERFYTDKELINGECPVHKRKVEWVNEESYFFKMSKYQDRILKFLEENKDFIIPEFRRKEIINRVKQGLKDLSISRTSFKWGIPLPIDDKHVIYVWFDALLNYLSALKGREKNWPADIHVIGKDILWFHAVIWPSILMAAGYELPKKIFVHGFINVKGEKLSKTAGIIVDPFILAEKYPVDAIRYFLLREIPSGEDGNFSEDDLKSRLNNELANDLGNLVRRIVAMINKYFDGVVEGEIDEDLIKKSDIFDKVNKEMLNLHLNKALEIIWGFVKECNVYINDKAPWKIGKSLGFSKFNEKRSFSSKEKDKEKLASILVTAAEALRRICIYLEPFIPSSVEKIRKQFGFKKEMFADLDKVVKSVKVGKAEILFKKAE